jgi:pyruvate dehydrogenase E1 component
MDAMSMDSVEIREWLESLDYILEEYGEAEVEKLLDQLQVYAYQAGVRIPFTANTPYINTIDPDQEPVFPGDRAMERRIKSIIRWNAMAMVVRANRQSAGVGGHISTFASCATLYEVGFNHFFRARTEDYGGDLVYFQGHSSPGVYARAFVEGRLTEQNLENFRRELQPGGGLSSYPHPRLMPDFWSFPTVSMGLGPIMSIYHARFIKYLENRGLKPKNGGTVWAFIGDGESDEPETLGAIGMAARENLDNLVWVINCNLQRLDGPVRGNHKIIQELERIFRGAGWNVLKVIWGSDWDSLIENDENNKLVTRMGEVVDGEYQKYSVEDGAYIREKFFGKDPELLKMVEDIPDEELHKMKRGGHDPVKVYAAYHNAVNHTGGPSVIIAKTIKGYGLGEAGEGRNITHQQKKLNEEELREFRSRFHIPISDEDLTKVPFYRPQEGSPEAKYLAARREALGGYLPKRVVDHPPLPALPDDVFDEVHKGSGERDITTTAAFVEILRRLIRNKEFGKYVVPIVPDEARTFGMEPLFRQCGIYSSVGQKYDPVDSDTLLYYKESQDGQILEEGITEAGSMSSFIAAGTAYANLGVPMVPFYIYYSMFGFQRIGDMVWCAGDMLTKGFMLGGTAGRTTLNGEGLQHQDGHSHLLNSVVSNIRTYDPAFAYEIAVIIQDGIKTMYVDNEDDFYYLTLSNEAYVMPAMPEREGIKEGIVKGLYLYKEAENSDAKLKAQLFGSGAIMNSVLTAQKMLVDYGIAADVWSVTSYNELRKDALNVDRWNLLHPGEEKKKPFILESLEDKPGVLVFASDYMKAHSDLLVKWLPQRVVSLGTDGYGKSESREALRDYFEVDSRFVTFATLSGLAEDGQIGWDIVKKAMEDLKIDPDKINPMTA